MYAFKQWLLQRRLQRELDTEFSYGALIHFKHYKWKEIAYWKWRSYVWCSFSAEIPEKCLAIKCYFFKLRNGSMHQSGPGLHPMWFILSKERIVFRCWKARGRLTYIYLARTLRDIFKWKKYWVVILSNPTYIKRHEV